MQMLDPNIDQNQQSKIYPESTISTH